MTATLTPMKSTCLLRDGAAGTCTRRSGRPLHAAAATALALVLTAFASPATTQTAASAPAAGSLQVSPPPLQTVASVDLSRYVGTWHEIARYPFGIQDRHCARDTTADYALLASGQISVVNRCLRQDGTAFVADGVAWVMDPQSRARLQVSFLPALLRALPVGRGDYWIIELAPDYAWVVIGEPQRRYLWVLARQTQVDTATWDALMARLRAQGATRLRAMAATSSSTTTATTGRRTSTSCGATSTASSAACSAARVAPVRTATAATAHRAVAGRRSSRT
jgi:apolipoprotein D and lipocalin family protein